MVTGSVAMNYYAQPRMTRDIDVVMALKESDAETLVNLFREDYYIDREAVVRAIAQRSIFNLIHQDSVNDTPEEIAEFIRRKLLALSGADRVLMGSRMFDSARAIMLAHFPLAFLNWKQNANSVNVFMATKLMLLLLSDPRETP
ncbi:MAG: hypothetical protein M3410_01270 [Acidobacteriota bacterium]|nr:hypothetical protein [Acidobacteriota bacterium]